MDNDILKKFEELEEKLDKVYRSAEKTRKIFLWTLIISLLMIVLPLIGLLFVIPKFLDAFQGLL